MGKLLTRLLRLSCTTAADAPVDYSAILTDVYVPQRPEITHHPDGKMADVLASTLACTTVNASVNYSLYVPQRPSKVPIAPMGFPHVLLFVCRAAVSMCRAAVSMSRVARLPSHRAPSLATQLMECVLTLKNPHRPNGILTCFALVLAGRRCLGLEWHGDLLIVHHHWQLSWFCACSRSKGPIAPKGF